MGADASLLQYLPTDKIYEATFEDKKRERPNSLPLRILFGQLQEGNKKGKEVWILLNKSSAEDRWPEHRFNIFDRTGRLLGGITVEDALRQSNPANAFKCLRPPGHINIDIAHLRAVIKYYFMVKKVDPQMPWPVDARFASQLIAACNVARTFAEKAADNNQTEKEYEPVANARLPRRPSFTAPQATTTNIPTNPLRTGMTTPANGTNTKTLSALATVPSMPHRSSIRSASTQPTRPLPFEDDDSLFVPEQPRRAATPHSFKSHVARTPTDLGSESEYVEEYRRAFQKKMLPQPALTPRSPPNGPRSNRHPFAIHQDTSRVNNTAPPTTPKSGSEEKDASSPLVSFRILHCFYFYSHHRYPRSQNNRKTVAHITSHLFNLYQRSVKQTQKVRHTEPNYGNTTPRFAKPRPKSLPWKPGSATWREKRVISGPNTRIRRCLRNGFTTS